MIFFFFHNRAALLCPRRLSCFAFLQKRRRSKREWQNRLEGHHQTPLVESNLQRLFAMRMRISRRAKVEADLSGLFNERKIPRYVDPEVNLRDLFRLKAPRVVPVSMEVSPVS